MKLTPDKIISLIEDEIKQKLKLEISGGDFTDPNRREIRLWWGEDLITSNTIYIVQKPEYEG